MQQEMPKSGRKTPSWTVFQKFQIEVNVTSVFPDPAETCKIGPVEHSYTEAGEVWESRNQAIGVEFRQIRVGWWVR